MGETGDNDENTARSRHDVSRRRLLSAEGVARRRHGAGLSPPCPARAGQGSYTGSAPRHFDILIIGGRVVDGTGLPWFEPMSASVVAGSPGSATRPGPAPGRVSRTGGNFVSPGFIDTHTHADEGLVSDDPSGVLPNLVTQGITSGCLDSEKRSADPEGARQLKEAALNTFFLVRHHP